MKNKKYLIIFLTIFALGAGLVILAPHLTFAAKDQYGIDTTGGAAGYDTSTSGTKAVAQIIGQVISAALLLVGTIFLILLVYAGYLWMIARGNTEKVERALDTIKAAVIGLIIVAGAYAITSYVVSKIAPGGGGGGTGCNGGGVTCATGQFCDTETNTCKP
jgi:hypothetical protein